MPPGKPNILLPKRPRQKNPLLTRLSSKQHKQPPFCGGCFAWGAAAHDNHQPLCAVPPHALTPRAVTPSTWRGWFACSRAAQPLQWSTPPPPSRLKRWGWLQMPLLGRCVLPGALWAPLPTRPCQTLLAHPKQRALPPHCLPWSLPSANVSLQCRCAGTGFWPLGGPACASWRRH